MSRKSLACFQMGGRVQEIGGLAAYAPCRAIPGGVQPAAKREAANRHGHGDFAVALTRIPHRHRLPSVIHEKLLPLLVLLQRHWRPSRLPLPIQFAVLSVPVPDRVRLAVLPPQLAQRHPLKLTVFRPSRACPRLAFRRASRTPRQAHPPRQRSRSLRSS